MNALLTSTKRVVSNPQFHVILVLLFAALLFFTNTFHEKYPDEFDSILGGKYILEGKVPYRDWFQHHNPFAYYWASGLLIFAANSFVQVRILLSISYVLLYGGTFWYIRKRLNNPMVDAVYLPLIVFIGFVSTYFWFHMLLADSLAAHLLLPAFVLFVLQTLLKKKMSTKDFAFITLLTFFAWFTSMTYIYVILIINLFACYRFFIVNKSIKSVIKAIVVGLAPYFLYFLYLVITGSLDDYYFANVRYNEYYVYNYPRDPGSHINPIRYAIVIFQNFVNNYFPLLTMIKDMYFGDPFAVTFALSNLVLFVFLMYTRRFLLAFFTFFAIIFSTARINPMELGERNYQASVYILFSSFSGIVSLYLVWNWLKSKQIDITAKSVGVILFIFLSFYWFFSGLYAPLKMSQKFFEKYMGTAPYIYDRPEIASLINDIAGENEYAWVGPFDFEELFYLKAKSPSKYHWFLQHAISLSRYHEGMIGDYETNRPKLIVFKRHYAPWGGDAYEFNYFFTDYLDKNYFRIFTLNETLEDIDYKWTVENTQNYDIDGMFHFDKSRQEEILSELVSKGYLRIQKKQIEEETADDKLLLLEK